MLTPKYNTTKYDFISYAASIYQNSEESLRDYRLNINNFETFHFVFTRKFNKNSCLMEMYVYEGGIRSDI